MSFIISEGEGQIQFTPCPEGTYPSKCVQLIDMGTQTTEFNGQKKTARKVILGFEILDDEVLRSDGSRFIVSKRFTASLYEHAALRGFLQSWRGRAFTAQELKAFDISTLVGIPCLLGVVHEHKQEKTYTNISSVIRLPKGMPIPEGKIAHQKFVMTDPLNPPDWVLFESFGQRLKDSIADSPEYKKLRHPAQRQTAATAAEDFEAANAEAAHASGFDQDGDIPF